MNGALVGTKHVGSRLTSRVSGSGTGGPSGPLVSTFAPLQSMAAVAATPPGAPGGNFVPAFRALVVAEVPLKTHAAVEHSSNISATLGLPGPSLPTNLDPC